MSTEKTEDPTPRRLRKLREKGDIPVSRELPRNVAMLCVFIGLTFVVPRVTVWTRWVFEHATNEAVATGFPLERFGHLSLLTIAALVLAGAFGAVVAGLLQTGFLFAPQRLKPDMKRMQFGQAWKSRLRKEVWFQGIIALVWTSCSLFAGYLTLRILIAATPELLQVVTRSANPISVIPAIGTITVIAIAAWLAISAVATLVDIAWQKAAFRKRNRMSHKEIEDEYKESEGDPQHKAKRKEFHREILSGGAVRAMTEASVLVRNPIHLAIALKYDPDVVDAPVVAAAGKGESARRLLKLARAQGIPEVTDPPTARSLIHVKVGSPIPDELFEPVAVIFRWLQQEQEGDNLAYGLDSPERESTRT